MHSARLHDAYVATKNACSWERSRRVRGAIIATLPFAILVGAMAFGIFEATRIERFGKAALDAFYESESGLVVLSAEQDGEISAMPVEDLAGNRTVVEWQEWMHGQHLESDKRVIEAFKEIVERKSGHEKNYQ